MRRIPTHDGPVTSPWWDGRPIWAVKAKDLSFLPRLGLRFGRGAEPLHRALRSAPGPWMVRHGEWVVVIGWDRAPDVPERLVLRADTARDAFLAERTAGGAVIRRVGRTGGRRIDEGRRGQKREPDLTRLDAEGVATLGRAWGVDLDVLPRALASRLERAERPPLLRTGAAVVLALVVFGVFFWIRREVRGAMRGAGGLGVRVERYDCADRPCAACAACVRGEGDGRCDVLRAGCDADADCRAIHACVAGCGVVDVEGGLALEPACRARCASAELDAVALAEAWLRCTYGPAECPTCAGLSLPEL